MSLQLKDHPELIKAYEKYQQFNHDKRLRALDEAHQRYLHDLATDIEAAHQKGHHEGREEGRNEWVSDKIATLLRFLNKKLGDVPLAVCNKLYAIRDLDVLGQLTEVAWDCESLKEFEVALGR